MCHICLGFAEVEMMVLESFLRLDLEIAEKESKIIPSTCTVI